MKMEDPMILISHWASGKRIKFVIPSSKFGAVEVLLPQAKVNALIEQLRDPEAAPIEDEETK